MLAPVFIEAKEIVGDKLSSTAFPPSPRDVFWMVLTAVIFLVIVKRICTVPLLALAASISDWYTCHAVVLLLYFRTDLPFA